MDLLQSRAAWKVLRGSGRAISVREQTVEAASCTTQISNQQRQCCNVNTRMLGKAGGALELMATIPHLQQQHFNGCCAPQIV